MILDSPGVFTVIKGPSQEKARGSKAEGGGGTVEADMGLRHSAGGVRGRAPRSAGGARRDVISLHPRGHSALPTHPVVTLTAEL